MRMRRIVSLAILAAAIAVAAGAGMPVSTVTADPQKVVAAGSAGAGHRNSSWETDAGALAPGIPPGLAARANRTIRYSDVTAPSRGEGRGIGPIRTVPVGPAIAVPDVTPTLPGVRFGQRRYLGDAAPSTPPIGNATVPGRALGLARSRTVVGTGTATGLALPVGRFVRWSPATRWRSGAT